MLHVTVHPIKSAFFPRHIDMLIFCICQEKIVPKLKKKFKVLLRAPKNDVFSVRAESRRFVCIILDPIISHISSSGYKKHSLLARRTYVHMRYVQKRVCKI